MQTNLKGIKKEKDEAEVKLFETKKSKQTLETQVEEMNTKVSTLDKQMEQDEHSIMQSDQLNVTLTEEADGKGQEIEVKENEIRELVVTKNTFESEAKNLNDELYQV